MNRALRVVLSLSSLIVSLTLSFTQTLAQNVAVTPNENLVVDGIPAIPMEIAEKSSRYTEFRTAAVLGWHPAKREMLITTRFGDVPQVHQVVTPGGARTQVTFFPDRVLEASYQPHKGNYFLFRKDIGGGEWFQYYRFDNSTGDVTLLTDGKSRNLGATWSNKGDRIAYASTRRNGTDLDFYVMNPADKSSDKLLVENQGGGWNIADWSPDDRTLLVEEYISVNESYLWVEDVASGKKTLITPKGGDKIAYNAVGFSADGKGIYVTSDRDNEFQRLAYIDLATKAPKYLTSTPWDVDSAKLSWNRKLIAYSLNENGLSTLHVADVATGKEMTLPKIPLGTIGGISWSENNHEFAFDITSAKSPSDVYSIDLTSGKLDRWTTSETGGLNANNNVEPQLVKWKSFDGREISGWLYAPSASKFPGKRPIIVNIHGGPEGQFRPGFLGRYNYLLNELGVAMVFPNVRGSTGYGKSFVAMDNGFKREDTYKDIEALLHWLKEQPGVDGSRIMVTGGSYGGHMTLATATRYNDLIACSLDVVGISNLRTFLEHTEGYRRDLRRVEYGDERDPKMRKFLEQIAPMNHVKNITKPMFVVAGANDPRVPKSEADQIVAALKAQNTPVWYLVGKNEGHGFSKKQNADFQFYATVMFVEKYLLGK
ncbi:MAG: S9 family peptidase [Terriglobia bacterium]|nr:S9 family peptidase [Terriglobia bacterium]